VVLGDGTLALRFIGDGKGDGVLRLWFYGGTGIDYGGRKCCWMLIEHLTLDHHVAN